MNDVVYGLIEKHLGVYEPTKEYNFNHIETVKEFCIIYSILKSKRSITRILQELPDDDPHLNKKVDQVEKYKDKLSKLLRESGRGKDALLVQNIKPLERITLSEIARQIREIWAQLLKDAGMSKGRAKATSKTLMEFHKEFIVRNKKDVVLKANKATGNNHKELKRATTLYKIYKKTYQDIIQPTYEKAGLETIQFHQL